VFDPTEKNLFIGALSTGIIDLALEGYWAYMNGSGKPVDGQFPYIMIHEAIPPVDDWIVCAGFPVLLYALGKGMKKESFVQMAKGGAVYGVSELIGQTTYRVAKVSQTAPARYIMVRR